MYPTRLKTQGCLVLMWKHLHTFKKLLLLTVSMSSYAIKTDITKNTQDSVLEAVGHCYENAKPKWELSMIGKDRALPVQLMCRKTNAFLTICLFTFQLLLFNHFTKICTYIKCSFISIFFFSKILSKYNEYPNFELLVTC